MVNLPKNYPLLFLNKAQPTSCNCALQRQPPSAVPLVTQTIMIRQTTSGLLSQGMASQGFFGKESYSREQYRSGSGSTLSKDWHTTTLTSPRLAGTLRGGRCLPVRRQAGVSGLASGLLGSLFRLLSKCPDLGSRQQRAASAGDPKL